MRHDPYDSSAADGEMDIKVPAVVCPNRICGGFIVLTPEEVCFLHMKDWESHLNLICPICRTRFQALASNVLEREISP
jgi:hypothetical protein